MDAGSEAQALLLAEARAQMELAREIDPELMLGERLFSTGFRADLGAVPTDVGAVPTEGR